MSVSFTNDLAATDFIRITFDYRTYVLASTGAAGVACSNALCSVETALTTAFTTVVKVVPSSLAEPIIFSI